ncbi:GH92 family glycosyl hydrolase [Spongiimicrobium sp. 3-5]|uniref:GH92 family glycosyl hydrolase n=1 Tax=Spongiimicrobium sp. 3-5 TaxID=3332596 RepID=UPI00398135C9
MSEPGVLLEGKHKCNNGYKMMRVFNVLLIVFSVQMVIAGPYNIAPEAKVSASTAETGFSANNVVDGIIRISNLGEWASVGSKRAWGETRLPWVQLDWDVSQAINKIVLYDRPTENEHTAGGKLLFSDGTEITVTTIPNNGDPKVVSFPARNVKWVRFVVTDGDGFNLGLSEVEVFPAPDGHRDLVSWVNPFIESAKGRYFFFTPAARPMGMVAVAPITRNKNQYGGGYNYNTTEVLGFGQIHGWCLSGIQIMPTLGNIDPTQGAQGWKSKFSHDDEIAMPGYQRLYLKDHKVWTELTSTKRTTLYRFKFTEADEANILANLGGYLGNSTMINANVEKVGNTEFEGSFDSSGRFWGGPENVKIFFVVKFNTPFKSFNGWNEKENLSHIKKLAGTSTMTRRDSIVFPGITQSYWDAPTTGVSAKYDVKAGDEILMKISISYTSIDNARKNMEAEAKHWDFDKYKKESIAIWNEKLSKIKVKGGSENQRTKFYTDLWHALLGRRILNDVNGYYPDYTQGERYANFTKASLKVRQLPMDASGNAKFNMYNFDALWLTQWNLNILWGLGWPEIMDDFSASLVQYADNGGLLPRGAIAGGYSYIMTGTPASNLLGSTMMKDLMRKADPEHAFNVTKRNHMPGGMMGDNPQELKFYIKNGWCPNNAGKTLEWAFQDWSLAQMAKKLGKEKEYGTFLRRSKGWRKLFNPEISLVLPKDKKGKWMHKDPLSNNGWIESNSWQGSWSVSHDIDALSDLMKGDDNLTKMLNHAFEQAEPNDFVFGYGSGYVSYANQPGCSNAHVFNHAGKPWLTQYWVRKVNEQAYGGVTPDEGYGGHDEDQGQMSGVSSLMSMGLFSLRGNNAVEPRYELTSPVFDEISIALNTEYYQGKEFKITVKNNSAENMYIQGATLNGSPLDTYWFSHHDFQKGGHLELVLGPEPNTNWGRE